MHCNGQCYLMQEMARISKEEQKKDAVKQVCSIAFVLMYVNQDAQFPLTDFGLTYTERTFDAYNNLYSNLLTYPSLRPPLV